jgi:hypothetical protein
VRGRDAKGKQIVVEQSGPIRIVSARRWPRPIVTMPARESRELAPSTMQRGQSSDGSCPTHVSEMTLAGWQMLDPFRNQTVCGVSRCEFICSASRAGSSEVG